MSEKCLRQTEIKHILKLEELFHNRFLNEELLNELVSLYVKAIGSLGSNLNLMKVYFLEKMQFLLSQPEIDKLLKEQESEKSTRDKYTIKISSIELEYEINQYVRKSSLYSQPVRKKLSEFSNQEQKTQERESRIKNQLELIREIEQSSNYIPLQKCGKQSSYLPEQKMNQLDFENEEVSLKENTTCKETFLRKNSDCFKSRKQVSQIFDGQKITKQYLLLIQNETDRLIRNMIQKDTAKKHNQEENQTFRRKKFEFESFCQQQNSNRKSDSLVFATFAPGLNSQQFRESQNLNPSKINHNSFSQHKQDGKDTKNMSWNQKRFHLSHQERNEVTLQICDIQSDRDYKQDDYF